MEKLKRYLITGFVVVVPIFLTFYVLLGIFRFADGILGRFLNVYLQNTMGFYIPGLGFFIALILIFITGFLATRFVGRNIIAGLEKWFCGLPLINKFYPALKQIILFIAAQKEFGFKKVVLVQYPSKGIWSIGFLTNEHFDKISKVTHKEMVAVFMPSTPGPLTGYMVFLPREEVVFLDISVSDALKIIISGGVFKP